MDDRSLGDGVGYALQRQPEASATGEGGGEATGNKPVGRRTRGRVQATFVGGALITVDSKPAVQRFFQLIGLCVFSAI